MRRFIFREKVIIFSSLFLEFSFRSRKMAVLRSQRILLAILVSQFSC